MNSPSLSASSLKDFVICQRRFQLRYLVDLPWPVVRSEPLRTHELHIRRGQQFHRMMERFYSGVDPSAIGKAIDDQLVKQWWNTFLEHEILRIKSTDRILTECKVQCRLDAFTVTAILDVLVIDPSANRITIIDWKTTHHEPKVIDYASAIQTRVYLYIIAEIAQQLLPGFDNLKQLEMIYWFPVYPERKITLTYSLDLHTQNRALLTAKAHTIQQQISISTDTDWRKTPELKHCRYCDYRTLCKREHSTDVGEASATTDFEFEQIDDEMPYDAL